MHWDSSCTKSCLFVLLTLKLVICTNSLPSEHKLLSKIKDSKLLENNREKRGLSEPSADVDDDQTWAEKDSPVVADKRRWKDMSAWGKRKWANLTPWGKRRWARLETWGKRSFEPTIDLPENDEDKRAWDKMVAWGKRAMDTDNNVDKRKWTGYNAWGKRDLDTDDINKRKWSGLHSWGKRDKSWNNFAPWGKRGKWDSFSAWGKRGGDQWKSFSAWGKRDVPDSLQNTI